MYLLNKTQEKQTVFNNSFKKGLADGLPICLGYLSVSFTFGIMAVEGGLTIAIAVLISMTNLTSAGQLAGIGVIFAGGSFIEMALTQLVINMRYALMSISLSQKMHKSIRLIDRLWIAFGNTDEIFAVSAAKDGELGKRYMAGLILMPFLGWSGGTLLGAAAGYILPQSVCSALGIAIYGMFIAIFIPPMKKSRSVFGVVIISAFLSCMFTYVPVLNSVSSGFVIIICAVVASVLGAILYPVNTEENSREEQVIS